MSKNLKINPDWEDVNVARYELRLMSADRILIEDKSPYRFRTKEDFHEFLQTGDLKLTVPQYIEVEE